MILCPWIQRFLPFFRYRVVYMNTRSMYPKATLPGALYPMGNLFLVFCTICLYPANSTSVWVWLRFTFSISKAQTLLPTFAYSITPRDFTWLCNKWAPFRCWHWHRHCNWGGRWGGWWGLLGTRFLLFSWRRNRQGLFDQVTAPISPRKIVKRSADTSIPWWTTIKFHICAGDFCQFVAFLFKIFAPSWIRVGQWFACP